MKLTVALFVLGMLGLASAFGPVGDRGTTLGDELKEASSTTLEKPLAPLPVTPGDEELPEAPDEI